ncbi:hypothetical protein LINPERHAP1_LOCUS16891, partial [Linum perenne]
NIQFHSALTPNCSSHQLRPRLRGHSSSPSSTNNEQRSSSSSLSSSLNLVVAQLSESRCRPARAQSSLLFSHPISSRRRTMTNHCCFSALIQR